MVNAHFVAKDATKPLHQLRRQGYFRQEVEHLFTLCERTFNQFDVDGRLPARGYAVEQASIALRKSDFYLRKGLLLERRQLRLQALGQGFETFQSSYCSKMPFLHKAVKAAPSSAVRLRSSARLTSISRAALRKLSAAGAPAASR